MSVHTGVESPSSEHLLLKRILCPLSRSTLFAELRSLWPEELRRDIALLARGLTGSKGWKTVLDKPVVVGGTNGYSNSHGIDGFREREQKHP